MLLYLGQNVLLIKYYAKYNDDLLIRYICVGGSRADVSYSKIQIFAPDTHLSAITMPPALHEAWRKYLIRKASSKAGNPEAECLCYEGAVQEFFSVCM